MKTTTSHYPPVSPALAVQDAVKALEFYKAAFNAVELYRLVDPQSGKVGHSEITINGSLLMLAEEYPAFNKSPKTLGGTPVKICLMVDNVDAATEQAKKAGATVTMPPQDMFYGHRSASLQDPFGHQWVIHHVIEEVQPAEMQRRWDSMPKK